MNLIVNKDKFEIFLEVARLLNKKGLIPILYGSLGLNKTIGKFGKVNDVDILVPNNFIKRDWGQIVNLMQELNFELKDEHEHEFIKDGEIVAFGTEKDLIKTAQVNTKNLKISELDGIKFKELSSKQYLKVYQSILRDKYRQEKRGGADQEKIVLIQKYLGSKKTK